MRFSIVTTLQVSLAACWTAVDGGWADPEAGRPPVESWSETDYHAADGNRVIARDQIGRLYVGNGGVLQYDGRGWSMIDINGAYGTRGLALADDGRIWVGAINEVGYLDNPPFGARTYRSLVHLVPDGVPIADVWGVHCLNDKTLFVCAQGVLIWDGTAFEHIAMPNSNHLRSFPFRGGIGISQEGTGVWLWKGTALETVDLDGAEKAPIAIAIPLSDGSELFDPGSRLGRLAEGRFQWLDSAAADVLADAGIVTSVSLPDGCIAVVSYTRGLVILKPDGTLARILDRKSGLPAQDASHAFVDSFGDLWIALEQYVVRMNATGAASLFDSINGFERGRTHRVVASGRRVLALSTEGVSELRATDPGYLGARLVPIADAQDYFADAAATGAGDVFLGGRRRIVKFDGAQIQRVMGATAQVNRLLPWRNDEYVVPDEYSIHLVRLGPEPEIVRTLLTGLPETPSDLAVDSRGFLWVTLTRHGIYAAHMEDRSIPEVREFLPSATFALPPNERRWFTLGGEAYVYTDREVHHLVYHDGPHATRELGELGFLAAESSGETDIWAVAAATDGHPQLVRVLADGGRLVAQAFACRELESTGRIWSAAREHDSSILWLGGSSGVLRIDLKSLEPERPPAAPVILEAEWQAGDTVTLLQREDARRVPFDREGRLRFEIRDGHNLLADPGRLEVRLSGAESRWTVVSGQQTYLGLREGSYSFEARTVDFLGNHGPVGSFSFSISPPWHRSFWAFGGYLLAAGFVVFAGVQFRLKRVARLNAQLEQLVSMRTEELTRAVAARSAFLATMGHEIRNPLNGVVGLVDTLRARGLGSDERAVVDRIGNCANQLVSAVEDVLEFSRIDAGRIPIRLRPFAIREPIEGAIDIFSASDAGMVIDLHADGVDLDDRIVGDPDRIRQVLVNYIANGIKFGGGSVAVNVSTRGCFLTVSVVDHGPGIPKDEQSRLFVRFSRGTLAYKTEIPGTGLGLAACKAYAEAMGGEVWVESEVGRGSTFYLCVPYRAATESDRVPTIVSPDIMAGRFALVVDDHEFNRVVLSDLLGRMGAKSTTAGDVPEAREAFEAHVPDIVFVDFDLPGSTGADLARWIRTEASAGRDVPVVATSAFEVDEIRRKCEEAGMDGFIAKPVTPQKVAEIMSRIETIRAGGIGCVQAAAPTPARTGFIDLLSDGDPKRRAELERSAWREILDEAIEAFRGMRSGNLETVSKRSHRLVSAALMLGLRDVVSAARELSESARVGDRNRTTTAAKKLQSALGVARRQRKG